jgi:hypothetical protein
MKSVRQCCIAVLITLGTTSVAASPIVVNGGSLLLQNVAQDNFAPDILDNGYNPQSCELILSPDNYFELTLALQYRFLRKDSCDGTEISPFLLELVQFICCSLVEPEPVLLIELFPDTFADDSRPWFSGIRTIWNSSWIYDTGDWDRSYHTIDFQKIAEDPPDPNPDEVLTVLLDTPSFSGDQLRGTWQNDHNFELQVTAGIDDAPAMTFLSVDNGGLGVCSVADESGCRFPDRGDMGEGDTLYFRPNTDVWITELVFTARYPGENQSLHNDSMKRLNMVINDSPYNLESKMDKDEVYYFWRPARPIFVPAYNSFEISHFREGFSLSRIQLYTAQYARTSYCLDCGEPPVSTPEPASFGLLLLGLLGITVSRHRKKRCNRLN